MRVNFVHSSALGRKYQDRRKVAIFLKDESGMKHDSKYQQ
jgi:hypothetical protein